MNDIGIMTHEQAVGSQAVERYLLGELTEDECSAFESHYFDCPVCFEQIKLSGDFLRHAREVLDPEPEPGFLSPGWMGRLLGDFRRPATAFVAAMLLCALGIGGYQLVVIAHLKAPRLESRYILSGATRSGPVKVIEVPRDGLLSLRVEYHSAAEFISYRVEIVSESGKVEYSVPLPAGHAEDFIAVRADSLDAGKYSLVVYGVSAEGGQTQVGEGGFDLQFAN